MSYAPKSNIDLSGDPTAPTPSVGDSDTSIATTGFVSSAVSLVTPSVVYDSTITPVAASAGSRAASLIARYDHALCVNPDTNKIYSIGGLSSASTILATVEEYDPNTNAWTTKTSAPQGIQGSRAVWVAPSIYILDGFRTASLGATSYKYTPSANTWTSVTAPSANRMRSRAGMIASGTNIYAIGGLMGASGTGGTRTATVDKFDTVAGTWTNNVITAMPYARSNMKAAISASGIIYVPGGISSAAVQTNECISYNLNSGSAAAWSSISSLPFALDNYAINSFGGSVVVTGGRAGVYLGDYALNHIQQVHIYDIDTDQWQSVRQFDAPMSHAHFDGGLIQSASGDIIYFHGGQNRDGAIGSLVFAFCLSLNLFTANRFMNIQAVHAAASGTKMDFGTLFNKTSDTIQDGGISAASGDVIHAPMMAWNNVSAKYKLMG